MEAGALAIDLFSYLSNYTFRLTMLNFFSLETELLVKIIYIIDNKLNMCIISIFLCIDDISPALFIAALSSADLI